MFDNFWYPPKQIQEMVAELNKLNEGVMVYKAFQVDGSWVLQRQFKNRPSPMYVNDLGMWFNRSGACRLTQKFVYNSLSENLRSCRKWKKEKEENDDFRKKVEKEISNVTSGYNYNP